MNEQPIACEIEILSHIIKNHCDSLDEVQSPIKQQTLLHDLQREGYSEASIYRAFDWLDLFGMQQANTKIMSQPAGNRVYSSAEMTKLGMENINFITTLTNNGIIDTKHREILITQLMELTNPEVKLAETKWVALMVLNCIKKIQHRATAQAEKFYLLISSPKDC